MISLTKEEIERIRHVNEMKRIAYNSPDHKLVYYPGANLVLLQRLGKGWAVKDKTGVWNEDIFEWDEIQ